MRGRRCRCRSPLSAPARKGVGSSWLRWSRPHDDHDGKPFARGSLVRRGAGLIRSGALGQQLAVYCVVRAKHALDDPLTALGLPLIAEFSDTLDEAPNTVTAISNGRNGGFEHWSLVLAFPSGLRATIDLGAGLGAAQSAELDLRVEWSGSECVVLVDPTNVAVRITNERGTSELSAGRPDYGCPLRIRRPGTPDRGRSPTRMARCRRERSPPPANRRKQVRSPPCRGASHAPFRRPGRIDQKTAGRRRDMRAFRAGRMRCAPTLCRVLHGQAVAAVAG